MNRPSVNLSVPGDPRMGSATIAQTGRRLTLTCQHGTTRLRSPGTLEGYPLATAIDTLTAAHLHRFPACWCARGIDPTTRDAETRDTWRGWQASTQARASDLTAARATPPSPERRRP